GGRGVFLHSVGKGTPMPLRVKLIVAEYQAALLYRDGKYLGLLRPGRYVFWNLGRTYSWVVFDLRGQSVSLAGQEVLTKDRVPVRFTLAANYRVADPAAAQHRVDHWSQQLYLDLQLALRELVADLTFDEVLDQKSAFGESVRAAVAPAAEGYGLE